jgi:hypothetical protein
MLRFSQRGGRRRLAQALAFMTLQLGFFENFKFEDSVLLEGSAGDIEQLAAYLEAFAYSQESVLAIHTFASVASNHPAQLFVSRSVRNPPPQGAAQFYWRCSTEELPTILGMLQPLVTSGSGHQYFNLIGSSAQLVVSVGEYGPSWWQAHG